MMNLPVCVVELLREKAIAFGRGYKLNIPLYRKINRLLIKRVGCLSKEFAKLFQFALRYSEQVTSARVGNRRLIRIILVLAGHECVAAVKGLGAGMSRGKNAANLVAEQSPSRRLMRYLLG